MDRAVLLARRTTLELEDLEIGGLILPQGTPGPFGEVPRVAHGTPAGPGEGSLLVREPAPPAPPGGFEAPGVNATLSAVEAWHVGRVLTLTGGHMGEAARILGIHRNTLTNKVRDHGLQDLR